MIIDAFPFYNEIGILKARLEYMGDRIDKFVILESTVDFSGRSKNITLTNELVSGLPQKNKIQIHIYDPNWFLKKILFPFARITGWRKILWKIQNDQRNSLLSAIKNHHDTDIVIFGDVDEFIDREEISDISFDNQPKGKVFSVGQQMYYYNLLVKHKEMWQGTAITTVSTLRNKKPSYVRLKRLDHECRFHGWHFSYFADAETIKNKISVISGAENLKSFQNISISEINENINSSLDLYGRRGIELVKLPRPEIPNDLLTILERNL